MPLTLTNSWGGIADNVYALIAEADEYVGSDAAIGYKLDPSIWIDCNTVQKSRLLLAATRDIDNAYNYVGDRLVKNQTLEFPRVPSGEEEWPWVSRSFTETNTFNAYLTEQRRRVMQATVEQAYMLIRDGDNDEHTQRRLKGISSFSESIGPISESASYNGTVSPLCPEAQRLLAPYIGYGVELVRS